MSKFCLYHFKLGFWLQWHCLQHFYMHYISASDVSKLWAPILVLLLTYTCFNCIFLFESYYCIWFLCFFVGTNKAHAKCVQQREEQIQKGLWELEGKWFECISPTFPERWLVLEGWYILQRSESQLQGNSQSKRQLFIIPSLLSFGSWQVRISVFKKLNCNEYWQ